MPDNQTTGPREVFKILTEKVVFGISRSDKGGAIVIPSREEYHEKTDKHLNNTIFYQEVLKDTSEKKFFFFFFKYTYLTRF